MLEPFIIIFAISYFRVGFRAFQQLNVVGYHWARIIPTSFAMCAAEVIIILKLVQVAAYWTIIPLGIGGSLGAFTAMWIHKEMKNAGNKSRPTKTPARRQTDNCPEPEEWNN